MNQNYFDRFSLVHAAVGAVAELSKIPAPLALGGQVAFEVVENDLKRSVKHIWPDDTPDGFENQAGDILSFALGYYGARLIKDAPAGVVILTGLAALAGGIWVHSLTQTHERVGR